MELGDRLDCTLSMCKALGPIPQQNIKLLTKHRALCPKNQNRTPRITIPPQRIFRPVAEVL